MILQLLRCVRRTCPKNTNRYFISRFEFSCQPSHVRTPLERVINSANRKPTFLDDVPLITHISFAASSANPIKDSCKNAKFLHASGANWLAIDNDLES